MGTSRTDSGAHAKGQVCHFDSIVPADRWVVAINQVLDSDIRAVKAESVPDNFHSRFWVLDRAYRYTIVQDVTDPFRLRYAYGMHRSLNVELMKEAATLFLGAHDFRAFTEELDPHITNTIRRLFSVKVNKVRDEVRIDIVGTAFLRGMMRRISGCLLEVGRQKRSLRSVETLLSEDRIQEHWPVVLPAKGLCLMKVRYGRHPRDCRDKDEEQ